MSETAKVVLLVLLTIVAFILSIAFAGWKMRRAVDFIMKDLKAHNAFDPATAVMLPYAKSSLFRVGMRDYRPKALDALLKHGVIGITQEGLYYVPEARDGGGRG